MNNIFSIFECCYQPKIKIEESMIKHTSTKKYQIYQIQIRYLKIKIYIIMNQKIQEITLLNKIKKQQHQMNSFLQDLSKK